MTRPFFSTKFRGTGQTECEVFQNVDGALTSLFTYGDATLVPESFVNFMPGSLATHWRGNIYAICPESGIFKNIPPATTATLIHTFESPHATEQLTMDWQVVFKDNKMQLFTMFHTTTTDAFRMVFIDEEDNVTTSAVIQSSFLASTPKSFTRGINFGNKIFSIGTGRLEVSDPVSETISLVTLWLRGVSGGAQQDLTMHSGNLYGYMTRADATVGEGNVLWNLSSAVPYVLHEWEAYQANSNEFPSVGGQNCIFSDGENLICMGYPSGIVQEELGIYKVNFGGDGLPNGVTDITDNVLGFKAVPDSEVTRFFTSRDIESESGVIKTNVYIGLSPSEGSPYHTYEWNGPNQLMTYKGMWGDTVAFDTPSYRIGGGGRTFSNQDELDLVVTNIEPNGADLDITYVIDGSAPASGVAMCIKYNDMKDSPLTVATVTPILNGVTNGNFIEELSTGESGVFRWNIAADGISPGDIPNIGAYLIRT